MKSQFHVISQFSQHVPVFGFDASKASFQSLGGQLAEVGCQRPQVAKRNDFLVAVIDQMNQKFFSVDVVLHLYSEKGVHLQVSSGKDRAGHDCITARGNRFRTAAIFL